MDCNLHSLLANATNAKHCYYTDVDMTNIWPMCLFECYTVAATILERCNTQMSSKNCAISISRASPTTSCMYHFIVHFSSMLCSA